MALSTSEMLRELIGNCCTPEAGMQSIGSFAGLDYFCMLRSCSVSGKPSYPNGFSSRKGSQNGHPATDSIKKQTQILAQWQTDWFQTEDSKAWRCSLFTTTLLKCRRSHWTHFETRALHPTRLSIRQQKVYAADNTPIVMREATEDAKSSSSWWSQATRNSHSSNKLGYLLRSNKQASTKQHTLIMNCTNVILFKHDYGIAQIFYYSVSQPN